MKFGARYYDPTLGRWTRQDPSAGSLANPKTLHRYAYAGCDPVNNIDPTGADFTLCSFEFFQTGVLFGVALALAPISLGESIVIGIIIETILYIGESVSCP